MTVDLSFTVADEELDREIPSRGPLQTGAYTAGLGRQFEPTAEIVEGKRMADDGTAAWQAIKIFFSSFAVDGTTHEREIAQTITLRSEPDAGATEKKIAGCAKAISIGKETLLKTCRALDLTQTDGTNTSLLITDVDELVAAINALSGTYDVYVKTKAQVRNGVPQLKDNGEPWMESEVTSVRKIEGTIGTVA